MSTIGPDTITRADVVAAGGVLWRPAGDGLELALVHRPRYHDWSLPKGKLDRGEAAPAAAAREIIEETGCAVRLGHRLPDVSYRVPEGVKVVSWWAARALGGDFVPSSEVDELRWLSPAEAYRKLSYHRDRQVLDRFAEVDVRAWRPLLLVRHAKAGERRDWTGADDLRPLSGKGRGQAGRLVGLLGLFGPDRVYSAPPLRCADTVAPLADVLGEAVRTERLFGEDVYRDDPREAVARLREIAREPGIPVVCSQGGVIPDLVGRLAGEPEPPCRKASTWVLGFAGDEVVTSDHYPPPE